jgi:hypothetical protein
MAESILTSVKKVIGLAADYQAFDPDVVIAINGVFSTLNDLGIGPDEGFQITDDSATWDQYLGSDIRLNNVKTYMWLRVRMIFDPPTVSFVKDAMEKQIAELEWRINVQRESRLHPLPVIPEPDLDGGEIDPDPTSGWSFDGGGP